MVEQCDPDKCIKFDFHRYKMESSTNPSEKAKTNIRIVHLFIGLYHEAYIGIRNAMHWTSLKIANKIVTSLSILLFHLQMTPAS